MMCNVYLTLDASDCIKGRSLHTSLFNLGDVAVSAAHTCGPTRGAVVTGARVQAARLFVGDPVWTPINRNGEADSHPSRARYLQATAA
jgi:hypothetical protein